MSKLTKTVTEKGKPAIIYEQCLFRWYSDLKSGNKNWRCSKKNCSVSIETDEAVQEVIKSNGRHNHEVMNEKQMQKHIVREECKKKACCNASLPSRAIIRTTLNSTENESMTDRDLNSLRQAIYEQRKRLWPTQPGLWEEAAEQVKGEKITTNRDTNFCFVEN